MADEITKPLPEAIDAFLGPEPEAPPEDEIAAVEAGDTPAPEVKEPEKPEPQGEEEKPEEEEEDDADPEPEVKVEGGKPQARPSWKQVRKTEKELADANARLAVMEQEQAQRNQQWELDRQERAKEQARLAEIEQRLNPKPEVLWNPSMGRPPTPQEMAKLQEEDPLLANQVQSAMAMQAAQTTQQQLHQVQTEFMVRNQIEEFKAKQPDYVPAIQFLEQREVARAKAGGMADKDIPAFIQERAGTLMRIALEQGKSVAELAYGVAVADGWKVPEAEVKPEVKAKTPTEKVQESKRRTEIERGAAGNIPGSTGRKTSFSRDDVANMSWADMEKLERESPGWDREVEA